MDPITFFAAVILSSMLSRSLVLENIQHDCQHLKDRGAVCREIKKGEAPMIQPKQHGQSPMGDSET